ncbi:uncharacterized protein LOC110901346 [Helianthus annuus]|uniref:uncharacterized protein LOC110901346 n=1 Tax=Helianthus annuus TaxID=4232 RepID=UPI000B908BA5|nr:uncharacterized protein LOC110901346 [Helianthus annuus]
MICGSPGNGLEIIFWLDTWINDEPLKDLFPNLFRLENNKWCKVVERIGDVGIIQWDWKCYPATSIEVSELVNCHRMISVVRLSNRSDTWRWNVGHNCSYSVKEARLWLASMSSNEGRFVYKWCKWLPSKCNVFMWRANLDRIPTASALICRNIQVGNGLCNLCGEVEETTEHLFTGCLVANGVWNGIVSWLKIPPTFVFTVKDVLELVDHLQLSASKKDLVFGIFVLTCWKIWATRNEVLFTQAKANVAKIVADVKSLSFLWFNSRSKKGGLVWEDWCKFVIT